MSNMSINMNIYNWRHFITFWHFYEIFKCFYFVIIITKYKKKCNHKRSCYFESRVVINFIYLLQLTEFIYRIVYLIFYLTSFRLNNRFILVVFIVILVQLVGRVHLIWHTSFENLSKIFFLYNFINVWLIQVKGLLFGLIVF